MNAPIVVYFELESWYAFAMDKAMHSTKFERKVDGAEVMNHRCAWKVGDHYEVVSRDATRRYRIEIHGGMPLCDCQAANYGLPCWHAAVALRRMLNEGAAA
jgi:hypothetical protein